MKQYYTKRSTITKFEFLLCLLSVHARNFLLRGNDCIKKNNIFVLKRKIKQKKLLYHKYSFSFIQHLVKNK
jgi:hypothetical protein